MAVVRRPAAKKRIFWDEADKVAIAEDVYEKFQQDITVPLLDLVKDYCSRMENGKARPIASLKQVEWLPRKLKQIHNEQIEKIHKTFSEYRKLQAKPEIVKMAPEQKIKGFSTSLLIIELMRRGDERLNKFENALKKSRYIE